jgi:hypothetical protein
VYKHFNLSVLCQHRDDCYTSIAFINARTRYVQSQSRVLDLTSSRPLLCAADFLSRYWLTSKHTTPPRNMLHISVKNCTAVTTASMHLTFHLSLLIIKDSQHACAHQYDGVQPCSDSVGLMCHGKSYVMLCNRPSVR